MYYKTHNGNKFNPIVSYDSIVPIWQHLLGKLRTLQRPLRFEMERRHLYNNVCCSSLY